MKHLASITALSLLAALGLAAQAGTELAGSWSGDKALGMVSLAKDGSGTITFESDSELRMAIRFKSSSGGRSKSSRPSPIVPSSTWPSTPS
jgi:hypothetical protein